MQLKRFCELCDNELKKESIYSLCERCLKDFEICDEFFGKGDHY